MKRGGGDDPAKSDTLRKALVGSEWVEAELNRLADFYLADGVTEDALRELAVEAQDLLAEYYGWSEHLEKGSEYRIAAAGMEEGPGSVYRTGPVL